MPYQELPVNQLKLIDLILNCIQLSLGVICIIFLLIFTSFFLLHKLRKVNEFKIKEEFNSIKVYIDANKFKQLMILSKYDTQLKNAFEELNKCKDIIATKMNESIKFKIYNLTALNSEFRIRESKKLEKSILKDLNEIEIICKNIKEIILSANNKIQTLNSKIVDLRELCCSISEFFENNLAIKYKNEIFKTL
jgi:hypothetical protein